MYKTHFVEFLPFDITQKKSTTFLGIFYYMVLFICYSSELDYFVQYSVVI